MWHGAEGTLHATLCSCHAAPVQMTMQQRLTLPWSGYAVCRAGKRILKMVLGPTCRLSLLCVSMNLQLKLSDFTLLSLTCGTFVLPRQ